MYVVYRHRCGEEGIEIEGLFRRRENAEAYVKSVENKYYVYYIRPAVTDFLDVYSCCRKCV